MQKYKNIFCCLIVFYYIQLSFCLPLFDHYPLLQKTIPYISLGNFPTPIYQLTKFGNYYNHDQIYLKDDSRSGLLFGGNKVRKLEFLLADAQAKKHSAVLTFGCAGSNHALATTIYAHQLGLQPICMLTPQHNSSTVQRNLLLQHYYGAHLRYFPTAELRTQAIAFECFNCKNQTGSEPYIIPTGGSCPLGIVGFVNAAFELQQQINDGLMPKPDVIYVPFGSKGTLAGLILGAKAAGLTTTIIGVDIERRSDQQQTKEDLLDLIKQTNQLLHHADEAFPLADITLQDIIIEHNFTGAGYAIPSDATYNAIKVMYEQESIQLDEVYSGKTCAAFIHALEHQQLENKVVLFWNTYCSNSFDEIINQIDYKKLPWCFHCYFEEEN